MDMPPAALAQGLDSEKIGSVLLSKPSVWRAEPSVWQAEPVSGSPAGMMIHKFFLTQSMADFPGTFLLRIARRTTSSCSRKAFASGAF